MDVQREGKEKLHEKNGYVERNAGLVKFWGVERGKEKMQVTRPTQRRKNKDIEWKGKK